MEKDTILAIIMAAGYSRRFGVRDKRSTVLPNGNTLLNSTLIQAQKAFPSLRVALRADDDLTALNVPYDIPTIKLKQPERGLGANLSQAIDTVIKGGGTVNVKSIAILLGDMPYISNKTYLTLRDRATTSNVIRPTHQGQPGHPVLFGREFWPELIQLSGDNGAKYLIQRHQKHYIEIAIDDAAIHYDIDTPADIL